jgi:hypothetical protein
MMTQDLLRVARMGSGATANKGAEKSKTPVLDNFGRDLAKLQKQEN